MIRNIKLGIASFVIGLAALCFGEVRSTSFTLTDVTTNTSLYTYSTNAFTVVGNVKEVGVYCVTGMMATVYTVPNQGTTFAASKTILSEQSFTGQVIVATNTYVSGDKFVVRARAPKDTNQTLKVYIIHER